MKNEASDEVERIGLDVIAAELGITPQALSERLDEPDKLKLCDLVALQSKFGFTDKMIRILIGH